MCSQKPFWTNNVDLKIVKKIVKKSVRIAIWRSSSKSLPVMVRDFVHFLQAPNRQIPFAPASYRRENQNFKNTLNIHTNHHFFSRKVFLSNWTFKHIKPPKTNMEPKTWRFKRWFSFTNWLLSRFQPFVFAGVPAEWTALPVSQGCNPPSFLSYRLVGFFDALNQLAQHTTLQGGTVLFHFCFGTLDTTIHTGHQAHFSTCVEPSDSHPGHQYSRWLKSVCRLSSIIPWHKNNWPTLSSTAKIRISDILRTSFILHNYVVKCEDLSMTFVWGIEQFHDFDQ